MNMLTIKSLIAVPVLTVCTILHAQDRPIFVTGNAKISVQKGTIACDFILSGLPNISNYVIRLNSGMNIHYFKDLDIGGGALYYDMDTRDSIGSDETKAYYLHENRGNPARYIPKKLEVKYLGMYPVIADSASGYMGQDWRGNIAFNGYSIRAEGLQGDWYPELYDMDKKRLYNEVKYHIHVSCEDCTVLFLNGSKPQKGTQADLENDIPCEMSMYCGKFATTENHGIWLLNSHMTKPDERQLFDLAVRYQGYYEKMFGIAYKGSLTFVQTTPVADTTRWGFSFYSAPTTFNVAAGQWSLQSLFRGDDAQKKKQSMAHELAHYYFGTLLKPTGVLGRVVEEGFAEYLSLDLTRSLEGESTYRGLLRQKAASLKWFRNYQPFSALTADTGYGDREYYLYYYAPVLFLAIKTEIGDVAMLKWLKTMIVSKTGDTAYPWLVSTLGTSLSNPELTQKIVSKYFTSPNALKDALNELEVAIGN